MLFRSKNLIKFNRDKEKLHPTQKPVALGRYLIRTCTNEGDLVLDNTCGVGSFLLSAKSENRNFIGIEIDEKYIEIANKRLKQEEFNVYEHGWKWDKEEDVLFWFIVNKKKLSSHVIKKGPPLKIKEHVPKFKKQYKGKVKVIKGRLIAKVKREFREVLPFVKKIIKDKYVKEKVKNIKIV